MNSEPRSRTPIFLGLAIGATIWLMPLLASGGKWGSPAYRENHNPEIELLILASLLLHTVSLVLALVPVTRRFGLGLLLACGLGWLILGAICGGVFK